MRGVKEEMIGCKESAEMFLLSTECKNDLIQLWKVNNERSELY